MELILGSLLSLLEKERKGGTRSEDNIISEPKTILC